jgi:hypothetical protein
MKREMKYRNPKPNIKIEMIPPKVVEFFYLLFILNS